MDTIWTFVTAHWLELTGAILSFIWVALEYRASMWLWPVGIILPLFYIVISWEASFIGNIAINIYYLITSIVGWIVWLRGADEREKPISRVSSTQRTMYMGAMLSLTIGLYFALAVHSSLPWADALSTSASVLGMVLLGRKHLEHWCCWMVANCAGAILFAQSGDYISTIVFSVNFVMSVLGLRHWTHLMRTQVSAA